MSSLVTAGVASNAPTKNTKALFSCAKSISFKDTAMIDVSSPKKILSNTGWLMSQRVINTILSIVVISYVARHLGPHDFGQLNYALNLVALFTPLIIMGQNLVVVKLLVDRRNQSKNILGTAYILQLTGLVIASLLAVILGLLQNKDTQFISILLVIVISLLPSPLVVIEYWFDGKLSARNHVIVRTVGLAIGSILRLALVYLDAPVIAFAWAYVFEAIIIGLGLTLIAILDKQYPWHWKLDSSIAKEVLKSSYSLVASGFIIALYLRLEQFLISHFLQDVQLGYYYAALRIIGVIIAFQGLLIKSLYPKLIESHKKSPTVFNQNMQLAFDIISLFGITVAIAITITAPWFVPILFGDNYGPTTPVLIILAWTLPVLFSASVRGYYFMIENLNHFHIIVAFMGIAINTSLGFLLIPKFGLIGAALTSVLGYTVSGYLSSALFKPLRLCFKMQTKAFTCYLNLNRILANFRK